MDARNGSQLTLSEQWAASEAAASELAAEQRAYLVGALARVRASSDLRIFVGAVYHHTAAGSAGCWWHVRIRELCGAAVASASQVDPLRDLLGCSERQAKRVAGQARQLGLVRTRPAGRDAGEDGRQPGESWEYQIDWLGVRQLVGLQAVEADRGQAGPGRGQAGPGRGQAGPGRGQAGPAADAPNRNEYPVPVPSRVLSAQIHRDGTGTGEACPRLLDGVTLGMLSDTDTLLGLLDQVCALAPIKGLTNSEADQHWWLTAAECALRYANDPVRYFRWLVQRNKRGVPLCPDSDRATNRLDQWREKQACQVV